MKKEVIIALFITLGVLLTVIAPIVGFFIYISSIDLTDYTENIEDYNTEKYRLPFILVPIFLDAIPENATVVRFSHYCYYHREDEDIYLELKFETKEEMDEYLSAIKDQCQKEFEPVAHNYNSKDAFVEVENPYNEKYIELFYKRCCISRMNEEYTGYSAEDQGKGYYYDCQFAVVSYSYEELTVIQAYTSGGFYEPENKYTPKYFIRFSVPLREEFERHYNVIAGD